MEGSRQTHLRVLTETGEVPDHGPQTLGEALAIVEELTTQIGMLERDLAGKRLRIANLEADESEKARENQLWPNGVAVFRYHQELVGKAQDKRKRGQFTADRFNLVAIFLRQPKGPQLCRAACRGHAASRFHMSNGYDEFWRVFATSKGGKPSQDTFEKWVEKDPESGRMPSLSQQTLIDHAGDIAGRVLERAELIAASEDQPAIAHLLLEIDALTRAWAGLPRVRSTDNPELDAQLVAAMVQGALDAVGPAS